MKQCLKMYMDSYRNIIETIRINSKMEELLVATCEKAYAFCEKYGRKIEM